MASSLHVARVTIQIKPFEAPLTLSVRRFPWFAWQHGRPCFHRGLRRPEAAPAHQRRTIAPPPAPVRSAYRLQVRWRSGCHRRRENGAAEGTDQRLRIANGTDFKIICAE